MSTANLKKTILIVHAGNEGKGFILQKMKQMGLRIVCLHREKISAFADYVDHWIIADTNNHKESITAVKSFIATHPNISIDGALAYWEEAVLLAAKITDTFNWIGIPYEVANKTKNKYLFRDFCKANGLPTPRFKLFSGKKDVGFIEKHVSYPLVMKPIYGAASFFVVKVHNRKEVEEMYEYIENKIASNWLAQEWKNLQFLVEEYIDGDEVDIDILLQNGKMKFCSIADNYRTKEPYFVETLRALPSSLPEIDQESLARMAEEILERLGVQDGCVHFEAKMTKHGPVPIEINLRMGGDEIYTSTRDVWGVDLVENFTKIALGMYVNPQKVPQPKKYILSQTLHADHSGMLTHISIDENIKKKSYIEQFYFDKKIGDPILVPPEGYEYLGWISVSGDNLLDAQDNLKEAFKHIQYKVSRFDEESYLGKTTRKNRPLFTDLIKENRLLQAAKIEKVRRIGRDEQRKLRIGILGNSLTSRGDEGEAILIQEELERRGYETTLFDLNSLFRTLNNLRYDPVDIIFNVSEEINGESQLEPQATALLETLQIPYTGSSSLTLALCRDKIKTKKFLTYHSIPTPRWDYAYMPHHVINPELNFPLIVKAGIRGDIPEIAGKLAKNKEQLKNYLHTLIVEAEQPALVEEYIEGKEYEVIILGTSAQDIKVLPLIRYTGGKGASNHQSKLECPAHLTDQKLASIITEIALDSYYIMRCRDYGSVRVRVDEEGNPYVIRIEANPLIAPHSSVARAAKAMKMDFGDLLEVLLRLAIERYKNKPSLLI
jgi:D-alanine-D-alanine ligase-like ATP-grasp enzyme